MTTTEYTDSEIFKIDKIYPRVISDWTKNNSELMSEWLKYANRFNISESLSHQWISLASKYFEAEVEESIVKLQKETGRQRKCVEEFRRLYMPSFIGSNVGNNVNNGNDGDNKEMIGGNDYRNTADNQLDQLTTKIITSRPNVIKLCKKKYPHKKLLPGAFSTAVINRFRVLPGDTVVVLLQVVATKIIQGEIPVEYSASEICDYIGNNGGFLKFADSSLRHSMIE